MNSTGHQGNNAGRHLSIEFQIIVTASYMIGIVGNLTALCSLRATEKNKRSVLTIRCLATNDLVALCGMLVLMYLQLYQPQVAHSHSYCVLRVVLRIFGLGSGCVAIVMAVERWLALTKPFLYKKYITYKIVKRSIIYLWMIGAALTCLPFLGFGLFFKEECLRYRDATEPQDVAYAYIFFTFGTLLCACIVWCNLGVMRELCRIGSKKRVLVRRISRTFMRANSDQMANPTAEELAFAKLMAVLCVSFVVCWMPQMISIPIAQMGYKTKFSRMFFRMADILMAVHFTLDPYMYVLLRYKRRRCRLNRNKLKKEASILTSPTPVFINKIPFTCSIN